MSNIRLLTYNIFMRPYGIRNNEDDFKCQRLRRIVREVAAFDVVCLQEAFDNFTHRRSLLLELAAAAGFGYFAAAPPCGFDRDFLIDAGLVILSKVPVEFSDFHTFEQSVQSDSLAQKGVLYARLALPGHKVHVFTTHTQASYVHADPDRGKPAFSKRLRQLVQLQRFVELTLRAARPEDVALLAGDLNVDAACRQYPLGFMRQLLDSGLAAALPSRFDNEYDLMHHIFNLPGSKLEFRDVYFHLNKEHHATYGEAGAGERALTDPADHDSHQTLDYVFEVCPKAAASPAVFHSATVEKFKVRHDKLSQLSDHYGVCVCFSKSPPNADCSTLELNKSENDLDTLLSG